MSKVKSLRTSACNVPSDLHTSQGHTCHSRVRKTLCRNLKVPGGRAWQPTPVFLPSCLENPHGQRSLAGPQFNPWGRKKSDTTGQLSMQKLKAFCHCWQLNMECNYQTDVEQSKWVTPMTNTVKLGKYREKLRLSGLWDITMKTYGFITNGNVYFHIWNYLIFGSLAPSLFHPFGR